MKPFEFLMRSVRSDLVAALEFQSTTLARDFLIAHPVDAEPLDLSDRIITAYRSIVPRERIGAAILARTAVTINEARIIQATLEVAFTDSDSTVRGFAWLCVAEYWRRKDHIMVLLGLVEQKWLSYFQIPREVICESLVRGWLDGIVQTVDNVLWSYAQAGSVTMDDRAEKHSYVSSHIELGELNSMVLDPHVVAAFLHDESPVKRLLAIAFCCTSEPTPDISAEHVKSMMLSDPDDSVRVMARHLYEGLTGKR